MTDQNHAEQAPEIPPSRNPDFLRMMETLEREAEESRARRDEAIADLSATASDEEIARDLGLDMNALRQDS